MKIDIDDDFEDYMRRTHHNVKQESPQWETMRITWFAATQILMLHMSKMSQLNEDDGFSVLTNITTQLNDFLSTYKKDHNL